MTVLHRNFKGPKVKMSHKLLQFLALMLHFLYNPWLMINKLILSKQKNKFIVQFLEN